MKHRNGFTLLEILVVVVITISITAFAVPAYKKAQERNKFLAAKGVLQDVGQATVALRADLRSVGAIIEDIPSVYFASWFQNTGRSEYTTARDRELSWFVEEKDSSGEYRIYSTSTLWFLYILFAKGYLQPIAFDNLSNNTSSRSYKGYYLYICQASGVGDSGCCKANPSENKIACIRKTGTKAECRTSEYSGAYVAEDGSVVPFGKNTLLAQDGCNS